MMRLHLGEPKNPGAMRFFTGSITSSKSGGLWRRDHFVIHAIRSWVGISFGNRWYFGLIRFGETAREVVPGKAQPKEKARRSGPV